MKSFYSISAAPPHAERNDQSVYYYVLCAIQVYLLTLEATCVSVPDCNDKQKISWRPHGGWRALSLNLTELKVGGGQGHAAVGRTSCLPHVREIFFVFPLKVA